jgi:hypothetical protein
MSPTLGYRLLIFQACNYSTEEKQFLVNTRFYVTISRNTQQYADSPSWQFSAHLASFLFDPKARGYESFRILAQ